MGRVRIGAVRLRGGAALKIFHNDLPDHVTAAYDRGVVSVRSNRSDDMIGYAVVAWAYNGSVSVDSLCGDGRAVNPHNLAQFVAAAITNQRTRYQAHCDVVGQVPDDGPDAA